MSMVLLTVTNPAVCCTSPTVIAAGVVGMEVDLRSACLVSQTGQR